VPELAYSGLKDYQSKAIARTEADEGVGRGQSLKNLFAEAERSEYAGTHPLRPRRPESLGCETRMVESFRRGGVGHVERISAVQYVTRVQYRRITDCGALLPGV